MAGNSNSGRKPLPNNVHVLQGNRSKKSQAELTGGIRPAAKIPDPPPHLQGDALAEWHRVAPLLLKLGAISEQYMAPLAVYCQAWADYVKCVRRMQAAESEGRDSMVDVTPSGYKQMSVHFQIAMRASEQLKSFASEFGMTPASVAKVTGATAQGDLFGYGDDGKTNSGEGYFT
ncbi:MAG: phage terminase small subunit P27 family [Proteobacteria bacterium]|nr:phage terminase small subunit P27 family [Pseudomonadota bacterium]